MATIKAGTYRFNDELTPPTPDSFSLAFNINGGLAGEGFPDIYFDSSLITTYYGISIPPYSNDYRLYYHGSDVPFYTSTDKWNAAYTTMASAGVDIPELKGWGQIITVTTDTEVDDDKGTWFTENTQMLIKAGTYRWNDVLTAITIDRLFINFTTNGVLNEDYTIDYTQNQNCDALLILDDELGTSMMYVTNYIDDLNFGFVLGYTSEFKWNTMYEFALELGADIPEIKGYGQTITITEDQYAPTNFGLWANENWQVYVEGDDTETESTPAVEITYKGEKIELSAGDVATLHIKDHKLTEDLVIKANAVSGSGGGSCSGNHIIEVDTLPTENIDENALYKVGETYYKYINGFKDAFSVYDGEAFSLVAETEQGGGTVELFYADNYENVTNPHPYDQTTGIFPVYYDASRDDLFLYAYNVWYSLSVVNGMQNGGAITDISQATEDGYYYAFISEWEKYIITPSGSETITENGTFDVTEKASVTVNISKSVEVKYGNFLTFSSPSSFTLKANQGKRWDGELEYSFDAITWESWSGSTIEAYDGVLYVRGTGNTFLTKTTTSSYSHARWVLTGTNISCSGNIETLLDYATVANGEHPPMANYCFAALFQNGTPLISAPALPATNLTSHCYYWMFYGCTRLTNAPALPATTLAPYCYNYMFSACTSLMNAPALPATTLADHCYTAMFSGCTSLTNAPALPATTLAPYCYSSMFIDCTSLMNAPALPATTLSESCYSSMFKGCTSLTCIPAVLNSALAKDCCNSMFSGCTSVKISASQGGEYQTEYAIGISGVSTSFVNYMFTDTGGTFTGTPEHGNIYYTSNPVIMIV